MQRDGRHHEVTDEVATIDGHEPEIRSGPRPQALHDAALVGPSERLRENLADGDGVVASFGADGYHGRRRIGVS
jgi:hypothetical protein